MYASPRLVLSLRNMTMTTADHENTNLPINGCAIVRATEMPQMTVISTGDTIIKLQLLVKHFLVHYKAACAPINQNTFTIHT